MTVSCGFFNGADRASNASQICSLFDGVITDGIFSTVGDLFVVNAAGGNVLSIGSGKAWFHKSWLYNDAIILQEAEQSDLLLNRIDAVVLEFDSSDAVRANTIKIVKGTAASNPVLPTLANGPLKFQHLISAVARPAGSTSIVQLNITPYQGTTQTPLVTGLVQQADITTILNQFSSEMLSLQSQYQAALQVLQQNGVPVHHGNHATGSSDPISPSAIGAAIPPKVYLNKTVAVGAWITDPTSKVPTHTKRAPISCPGVTTAMSASVMFSDADLALDLYSTRCDTDTDIIYIYARSVPSGTLTVLMTEAKLVTVVT